MFYFKRGLYQKRINMAAIDEPMDSFHVQASSERRRDGKVRGWDRRKKTAVVVADGVARFFQRQSWLHETKQHVQHWLDIVTILKRPDSFVRSFGTTKLRSVGWMSRVCQKGEDIFARCSCHRAHIGTVIYIDHYRRVTNKTWVECSLGWASSSILHTR